eukprot:TRINITY_DN58684_c1_g1_i3.p1 TRINITY_DN58684_c1_g1~~TRINITY_DN58684_c1_g1_i3.p1  ORF type:complete len:348 (+),score=45.42 TRINITY_DN58684_c1_g1_i3:85-1044(+)
MRKTGISQALPHKGIFMLLMLFGSSSAQELIVLEPFTKITTCAPFNFMIRPSQSLVAEYALIADIDESLEDVLEYKITDGVLQIESSGDFDSENIIQVILELPDDVFEAVSVWSDTDVAIVGNFTVQNLTIVNLGKGLIYVPDMKVLDKLTIANQGNGVIAYQGFVEDVDILVEKGAQTYLSRVGGKVVFTGRGTSKTYINPTTGVVEVTGSAASLAQVNVAGENCESVCTVQGSSRFRSPCKCIDQVNIPRDYVDPSYSCGIEVEGPSKCIDGTVKALTSSQNGGSAQSSFATAGSPVTDHVVSDTECEADKEDLLMS